MRPVVKKLIKSLLQKPLILLKDVWFVSPEKCKFSVWYRDKLEVQGSENSNYKHMPELSSEPVTWKYYSPVELSGVCVLPSGKLLMCKPLNHLQHHPDSRKAIVCTKSYRPLEHPHLQSLTYFLALIRSNFSHWSKKENSVTIFGKVALLGNSVWENTNYYHFWSDVIADIWFIKQNLPANHQPDYYLVPHSNTLWQWDVMNLCGIQESQVIPYAKHDVVTVSELIIPLRDKGSVNLPPWLCHAIHEMSGWLPRSPKGKRLIFVSRADASRRRVANESTLRDLLCEKGFEVHTLDGLSLAEQQQLFSSASIICAPHGASLTNLVWCGLGTVVIDFLSEKHLNPCFKILAEQNKLIYYPYVCRQVERDDSGITGDIVVSNDQVESVLKIVNFYA